MTALDVAGSVVAAAKARVDAIAGKGLSYVPQILDAHQKVVSAERSGMARSLDLAIGAGELLIAAKEAINGQFRWGDWRAEHLPAIAQTTASLYMRLAKNQDRLRKPDLTTDDGKRISNGLLKLGAEGQLSIKKAASLLAVNKPRGGTAKAKRTDEDVGKEWLKALAADDLIAWLKQLHDVEYRQELWARLGVEFQPAAQ